MFLIGTKAIDIFLQAKALATQADIFELDSVQLRAVCIEHAKVYAELMGEPVSMELVKQLVALGTGELFGVPYKLEEG